MASIVVVTAARTAATTGATGARTGATVNQLLTVSEAVAGMSRL
jgi:hypothetical protein